MAGISVAYELSRRGRVCLLETENRPGLHATGRSAALFAPSYGGVTIRAVTRASRAFFDEPPIGFCEHPLLTQRGCLYLARSDQESQLTEMAQNIRASGGQMELMSGQEAMAYIPLLRPDYIAQAAFDSDAMDIDVDALQRGFLVGARNAGTVLVTNARVADVQRRRGIWTVALNLGKVSAPILINAAGAWADELARICAAHPLDLRPLRRTALVVDAPEGTDIRNWPAAIDVDELFYFKPDASRLLVSPADETPQSPGDAQPEELDIAIGVDRVQAALQIQIRRVSYSWAGLRTFSPDRVPVVGFDPDIAGFFWCVGQGGYGIQTAPAMARIAAAQATGESLPSDVVAEGLDASDLSPNRFDKRG